MLTMDGNRGGRSDRTWWMLVGVTKSTYIMFRTNLEPNRVSQRALFWYVVVVTGRPPLTRFTKSSNRSHRTPTSLLAARCISSESRAACWEALAYALFLSTYRVQERTRCCCKRHAYGMKTFSLRDPGFDPARASVKRTYRKGDAEHRLLYFISRLDRQWRRTVSGRR